MDPGDYYELQIELNLRSLPVDVTNQASSLKVKQRKKEICKNIISENSMALH